MSYLLSFIFVTPWKITPSSTERLGEVIVPSNTYIATVLAISQVGATPIFVEPHPETYNIDYKNIEGRAVSVEA